MRQMATRFLRIPWTFRFRCAGKFRTTSGSGGGARWAGELAGLRRALTLARLLTKSREAYSAEWWRYRLLAYGIRLAYGIASRSPDVLTNLIETYEQWRSLGVIERSGLMERLRGLKEEAERVLRTL